VGAPSFRSWGPFVLPAVYLLVVFALQPGSRLGPPEEAPWLERFLYDDWDLACFSLRGWNAYLGRSPGYVPNPTQLPDGEYERRLGQALPRARRYFLEHPHGILLVFQLAHALQPMSPPVPAALLDGGYGNLVEHTPSTEEERALWTYLRWNMRILQVFFLLCVWGLVLVLRAGYELGRALAASGWLLLLPATLYFTLHRYDIVAALLVAGSLACLGRNWLVASGFLLGLATLVKLYPILLAPLILRYLGPRPRACLIWLGIYAATGLLFLLGYWALYDAEAVIAPYRFQFARDRLPPTIYGLLVPDRLAEKDLLGQFFRRGSVLLTLGVVLATRPTELASLFRRGTLVLIVFTTVAVFYSPQWILWFVPLLLPLASSSQLLAWLVVALDIATYYTFPALPPFPPVLMVLARYAILATIVGVLARQEWKGFRETRSSPLAS
jgi:hypothetical protein